MENFRRRVCCCEIFLKDATLKLATKAIILGDIVFLIFWIVLYVSLIKFSATPAPDAASINSNGIYLT